MIGAIKEQAARFILKKRAATKEFNQREFSSAFQKSFSFLILMPADDKDFRLASPILEYLREQKKNIVVLTNDYRISLLPPYFKTSAVEHGVNDITKLNLPSKNLISKLTRHRFDVILDLNREEELYYSFITKMINAPLKIGFVNSESDNYFNMQIVNSKSDPEISYKNLLNCLKMF
jgi:ADP-heptose:LPS heptosyltransferase